MHFAQLFWTLSTLGAALFFVAGLSSSAWRRAYAQSSAAEEWESERASLRVERDLHLAEARAAERLSSGLRAELAQRERDARDVDLLRGDQQTWLDERAALLADNSALVQKVADAEGRYARLQATAHAAHAREAAERARLLVRLEVLEAARRDDAALPPIVPTSASGSTFTAILERIGASRGMRSAVLGDDLGLPIASLGEHPESLAGFCGFLSRAASRAADFLPLGHIRRIVLEDDRAATLTACSLEGSDIFVATLTNGPGPELLRMVQILNDASSFIGERNHA